MHLFAVGLSHHSAPVEVREKLALPPSSIPSVLSGLRERQLGHVEFVQAPGEVVAFPAGWWHAVVNLTPTLAITESFGLPRDLPIILEKLRASGLHRLAAVIATEQSAAPPKAVCGKGQT